MTTLTVSVDPGLSAEVDAWTDGAEYTLRVRQDSPGQFTALEGYAAEVEEQGMEAEMPMNVSGNKNPAIANMMNRAAS